MGETAIANDRYRLELADYQNTYYGRLASMILDDRGVTPVEKNVTVRRPPAPRRCRPKR